MKSSKNTKAVIVGLFTTVGIAIFLVGVFTLGGQHKLFVSSTPIKALFADISGLQPGNNVWYQGVSVGTVKTISFLNNSLVEVNMKIENKSVPFIHHDARAKIGSDGLIGNRIVVIVGGSVDSAVIKEGDILAIEKTLSTDDLLNTLQKNNLNLLEITGDIKTVTHGLAEGKGTVGKLLKDESLFRNLQSVVAIVKQASVNTRQLTANLDNYAAKFQTKGSFADDIVSDTVIFSKLRVTVSQIEQVSKTINEVADNLQSTTSTLNKGIKDTAAPVGMLLHSRQSTENLKAILDNLKSSSIKLDQDLEALQHNIFFRGFFRKKEKEAAKAKKQ